MDSPNGCPNSELCQNKAGDQLFNKRCDFFPMGGGGGGWHTFYDPKFWEALRAATKRVGEGGAGTSFTTQNFGKHFGPPPKGGGGGGGG
jgi:hypothetical protein